ncbi:MAG: GHKL domain-containing protein [Eubacterium sp.]
MDFWFVWEICVNAMVIIAETYMLHKHLKVENRKKTFIYVGVIAITAIISYMNFIDIQLAFPIAPGFTIYATRSVVTALMLLFSFLVFEGTPSEKILWSFVPMLLSAIADAVSLIVVTALTGKSISALMDFGLDRFWITLINIGIIAGSCIALGNTKAVKSKHSKLFIPDQIKFMLILLLLLGTISVDILVDNTILVADNGQIVLNIGEIVICATFLVIIGFTFILVTRVGLLTYENMEYTLEVQQSKLEKDFFRHIDITTEELRESKHDMRNHLSTMQILLSSKDYQELEKYFDKMNGEIDPLIDIVLTNNKTLNSIIYSKMIIMKTCNISFHYTLLDVEQIQISEYDLCSILGNLLDNAIEACQKIETPKDARYIRLKIKKQENMFMLSVNNSFNGKYNQLDRNHFATSKKGQGHGLGLRHVERIIQRYGGHMQVIPKLTDFTVVVFLPCLILSKELERS